jgi:outer membrane protein assembly factor BamB
LAVPFPARAEDWPEWRGPEQTGVSREKDLPAKFSLDPNAPDGNLIWTNSYGGRTTPIVLNNRVYVINRAGEGINEQERVMCFDADTGKVLWEYKFNVFLTGIVSDRLGWTNMVADRETGNVYAHGTQGLLFCCDGKTGKVLWSHSMTAEYCRIIGYGGRVTSPVLDGDLLILGMVNASWGVQARGGNRYIAFDKRTGVPVWWSPASAPPRTYYSTPVVAVINGERLLISGGAAGDVHAFKVRTGQKVWGRLIANGAINSSPVVAGNFVYIGHGEENVGSSVQGAVVCLDASTLENGQPKLVWKKEGIKAKFASPILHEGRLYIPDDVANLFCFDAKTGKQLWKKKYGRGTKGSPVWADGKIYVAEVFSRFLILEPGRTGCKTLYTQVFHSPDGITSVVLNGSPAVANGRVYFMTSEATYCIGKKDHTAKADPIPPIPKEVASPSLRQRPKHLQVVPADVVLQPGRSTEFRVRAFDGHGRFLKEVKADWSLAAMLPPPPPPNAPKPSPAATSSLPPLQGKIEDGKLTVADNMPGQFGRVLAKAEGLTGQARVRVVPRLPYKTDFAKVPVGRTPAGWVNCQGKFAVVALKDGAKALKKLATNANPALARAYAFIDLPTLTDYTIQSDLMGTQVGADLPDLGVVANRYTLQLSGNSQRLRLLSWDALPRVDKSISWNWKPGVWYRMKLTVAVQGDKAVIRGKVWPRDEQEPSAWSIDFEDPTPNREGSPALYGYATGIQDSTPGAECFYQNLQITPNQ